MLSKWKKKVTRIPELIDTLWNVNIINCCFKTYGGTGINRYIMECKFVCKDYLLPVSIRINRYIMECKYLNNHILLRICQMN